MTTIITKKPEVIEKVSAQPSKQAVYETKQLNLWYGSNHALKNIDLEIMENEVTAIIGPQDAENRLTSRP